MFFRGYSPPTYSPSYSGLSPLAPPFTVDHSHFDRPHPFSSASDPSASYPAVPPSTYPDPYPYYHPPTPSSSGENFSTFEVDLGGVGLFRQDGSLGGDYGSDRLLMDPQPRWNSLMFGRDPFAGKGHYGSEYSGWLDEKHPSVFEKNAESAYSGRLFWGQTGTTEGMSHPKPPDPFVDPERCNIFDFHGSNHGLMDGFGSQSAGSIFYEPPATFPSSNQLLVSPTTTLYSSEYNIPRNGHSTVHSRCLFDHTHSRSERDSPFLHPYTGGKDWYAETSNAPNDVKGYTCLPGYLTPVQRGFSSDNEPLTGKSMQCAVDISDIRRDLDNSNSLTSISVPAEPVNSMQTFLETVDHLNLSVDSPCWKGASGSQQSPFSVGEAPEPGSMTKESEKSNESQQFKNHLLNSVHSEAMSSAKLEGNLIGDKHSLCSSLFLYLQSENREVNDGHKATSSALSNGDEQGDQSFKVIGKCRNEPMSQGHHQPEDSNLKFVDHGVSLHFANESSVFDGIVDTEKGLMDSGQDSTIGSDSCAGVHVVNDSKFSLPGWIAESLGPSDFLGEFSPSENNIQLSLKVMHGLSKVLLNTDGIDSNELKEHDYELLRMIIRNLEGFNLKGKKDCKFSSSEDNAQLFLKAMHGLTKVLLNTDCVGNNELKEHDYELLQMIIWNLEGLNLKNKKGKGKGSSHISGVDAAVPDVAPMKVDGTSGKMHFTGCNLDGDSLDKNVPASGIADSVVDYMTHALEKISIESPFGQEENPQTKFYKKLWIDAEIASCAVKYELQLLRMNAEMENDKHKAKESLEASCTSVKPMQFPRTLSPNSLHVADVVEGTTDDVKERLCHDSGTAEESANASCNRNSHVAFPLAVAGAIDSSVMTRFHILNEQLDEPIGDAVEDRNATGIIDIAMQNKGSISSNLFDSDDIVGPKSVEMMHAESDTNFSRGQPNATAEPGYASQASKARSGDASYFSGSHIEVSPTVFHTDSLMNQSYSPIIHGNKSSSGYDSSSEWEHVMDEEFTLI
ncbi:hypothetical protein J5N97_016435 [Dioscorea zingiberensis]|uniref:Uncharacterized protein n=1 Tax=Dioscorea zingiberensis TaxID=325984 RepID=A0A9D5CLT0_9LILI|nr:hypothetical protein J5N97_016435 [Dioscorea zingiberensis]